jgi:hypothetical protein
MGLALHSYHDIHRRLPPGWTGNPGPEDPSGWGWAAAILDQVEQGNVRSLIQSNLTIDHPSNQQARESVVPIYICPTDILDSKFVIHGGADDEHANQDQVGSPMFQVAKSNYIGVFGLSEIEDVPSAGEGVFFHNSRLTFASVSDGLSNTLLIGERGSKLGSSVWAGVVPGANGAMARVVGSADHTPNDAHGHFDDFSSFHPLGVHFLVGDGSVQRINVQIDINVYHALVTRSGGEVVAWEGQ